jgi:hypothetical protein
MDSLVQSKRKNNFLSSLCPKDPILLSIAFLKQIFLAK